MSSKTINAYEAYLKSKGKAVPKVDVVRGAWWPHIEPVQSGEETEAPPSSKTTERRSG